MDVVSKRPSTRPVKARDARPGPSRASSGPGVISKTGPPLRKFPVATPFSFPENSGNALLNYNY